MFYFLPKISRFLYPVTDPPSFHQVSAYARLGHKYQIDSLLAQALEYLEKAHPANLGVWQKSFENVYTQSPGAQDSRWSLAYAIGVVNIARLTGCEVILPSALLVCCSLDEKLVLGFEREDGTQETLSLQDVGLCLRAARSLPEDGAEMLADISESRLSSSCETAKKCREEHRGLVKIIWDCITVSVIQPTEYYKPWSYHFAVIGCYWDICLHCRNFLKNTWVTGQLSSWNRLPKLFKVDIEHWGKEIDEDMTKEDVSISLFDRYCFTHVSILQLKPDEM